MLNKLKHIPFILAALQLSGCGSEPEWVEVYEQCKETVESQSEQLSGISADSDDEQNREMAESMGRMAMNMAMSACEMIRTSCEEDADSPTCRAYLEQAKQNR
jgi:hypothetical protein